MSNESVKAEVHNGAHVRRVAEDILALAAGLGAGAGLMYLYDPDRGRSRRKKLTSEAAGLLNRGEKLVEKQGIDLLNRARGLMHDTTSAFLKEEIPDDILAERIRSRMGHVLAHPHEVNVKAQSGVITLEGSLSRADRARLTEEVEAMPGVKRVKDHLAARTGAAPGMLMGLAAGLAVASNVLFSHARSKVGHAG